MTNKIFEKTGLWAEIRRHTWSQGETATITIYRNATFLEQIEVRFLAELENFVKVLKAANVKIAPEPELGQVEKPRHLRERDDR